MIRHRLNTTTDRVHVQRRGALRSVAVLLLPVAAALLYFLLRSDEAPVLPRSAATTTTHPGAGASLTAHRPEATAGATDGEAALVAAKPTTARRLECPQGYREAGDSCIPLRPDTGEPYTPEELAKFKQLALSVGKRNFFVPRVLSEDEARHMSSSFDKFYRLGDAIKAGRANQEMIDNYYSFYERLIHYKRQILGFALADVGGKYPEMINGHPELMKYQEELDRQSAQAYRQRVAAYQQHRLDMNSSSP